jgi:hypothetical protein
MFWISVLGTAAVAASLMPQNANRTAGLTTWHLKFFIEGNVVPICYDFDISPTGVLSPSKSLTVRSQGCVLIVLASGGGRGDRSADPSHL